LLARATAAAAIVALGLPAAAGAHSGTLVSALDYRAVITSVGRARDALSASVVDGDRKLELRVPASTTVVVLGYAGEPFIRFAPAGVEVNERSLSAVVGRLAKPGSSPALDPASAPVWSLVARGHRYAWHDHRLGPTPGRTYGRGDVAGWSIPIRVDGRGEAISGRLLHEPGPRLWPWLVLAAATAVLATVLASSRRLAERPLYAGALLAGLAALVLSVSFAFVPGASPGSAWTDLAIGCAVAALALLVFIRVPTARHAVAGFVAVLATLVGLSETSVLVHGFVVSSLPASAVRGATVVAVCAGSIAAACSAGLLFRDRAPGGGRSRTRRPTAVLRGRP
jgi:hypothetical protein